MAHPIRSGNRQAIRWKGTSASTAEILDWMCQPLPTFGAPITVKTRFGHLPLRAGDWVVREGSDQFTVVPAIGKVTSPEEVWPACACRECQHTPLSQFSTARRLAMRMPVCSTCGNKRCPKATRHTNICTHSNEPGQHGSVY